MNKKINQNMYIINLLKWIAILFILILIFIYNNYIFFDFFIKKIINTFFILSIFSIFLLTFQGKSLIILFCESYIELNKIIWPTLKKTIEIGIIVIIITFFTSIFLWIIDKILIYFIYYLFSLN